MTRKSLLVVCCLIVSITAGCTYKPVLLGPEVGIKEVKYYPKYFCSGESIFFEVKGININKIRIQKVDGSNLLEMLGESGMGTTPPMRAQWLPLSVKVFSSFGNREESLEDRIFSIDNESWTDIYMSSSEILEGNIILDHVENVQEFDSATNSLVDLKIYDVYQKFAGFQWEIPLTDFAIRAALLEVKNEGVQSLVFRLPGGDQTVPPGQSASISGFPYPSGRITARYASVPQICPLSPPTNEPWCRLVGRQKGERTKPENDHFTFQPLYAENKYPLRLKVICQSATG